MRNILGQAVICMSWNAICLAQLGLLTSGFLSFSYRYSLLPGIYTNAALLSIIKVVVYELRSHYMVDKKRLIEMIRSYIY